MAVAAERAKGVPVELAGVRKSYDDHLVLAGVDLSVAPGELVAIVGQSGTGKSGLLRPIVGLERPDAGRITVGGIELREYLALPPEEKPFRIAMVFQSSALLASLTVAENVGLRLRERGRHAPAEIAAITRRVLEQVELAGTEDQLPGELSGGMRKRVAIARALAVDPELILYDEPTADLDPILTEQIGQLIARIRTLRGSTQIIVTHNLPLGPAIPDLSGDRFIALTLGTPTAKRAEPGDTLEGETPAGFAEVVDQLSTVAESVTNLTDNLNRNAERLLANLADLVEENRGALGATAQNLASITGKLDRGTGTRGLLLNDRALYDRVTDAMGDVRRSVGDLGVVAHSLAEGKSTLGKLVSQDDGLYAEVRETVASLGATARNAEEITDNLRTGQGTVGKALTDDSLYTEAQDTLRTVNRATQSVEDQSAISLLGTVVTSLF